MTMIQYPKGSARGCQKRVLSKVTLGNCDNQNNRQRTKSPLGGQKAVLMLAEK